jgi:hypothetical protein
MGDGDWEEDEKGIMKVQYVVSLMAGLHVHVH